MEKLDRLDLRVPAWNLDGLVTRACPLCDRAPDAPRFERPDQLTVCECAECTTWFVSPAPTDAALDRFYSHYDATHRREAKLPWDVYASAVYA